MASDLTVDNLCEAIRFHLHNLATLPDEVATIGPGFDLKLHGVPADDTMKAVMERLGGMLRIEVRELPAELSTELLPANPDAVILWHPDIPTEQDRLMLEMKECPQ